MQGGTKTTAEQHIPDQGCAGRGLTCSCTQACQAPESPSFSTRLAQGASSPSIAQEVSGEAEGKVGTKQRKITLQVLRLLCDPERLREKFRRGKIIWHTNLFF